MSYVAANMRGAAMSYAMSYAAANMRGAATPIWSISNEIWLIFIAAILRECNAIIAELLTQSRISSPPFVRIFSYVDGKVAAAKVGLKWDPEKERILHEGWRACFADGTGRKEEVASAAHTIDWRGNEAATHGGYLGALATVADDELHSMHLALSRENSEMLAILSDSQAATQSIINRSRGKPPRSDIEASIKSAIVEAESRDVKIVWGFTTYDYRGRTARSIQGIKKGGEKESRLWGQRGNRLKQAGILCLHLDEDPPGAPEILATLHR
ncbi:hypothetical protein BGX38DRAFT_1276718 [Terfezia claveryi]|nr:hypothetical protein BGX38DRAFT_1276718 [Terfezia claveryi]